MVAYCEVMILTLLVSDHRALFGEAAMTICQRILIAVANGCHNTRQISKFTDLPLGTVNDYFYRPGPKFKNGDLLQWTPDKANTLRLGTNAAVVRHQGQIVAVMRAEKIERLV